MHEDPSPQGSARLAVTIGALGVVFGDIWTSPLYTIQTIFSTDGSQPIALTRASVYGLISMVVWSVTIIVTLKCVLLVMRADNDGKRGIFALIIPISRSPHRGGRRTALVLAALGIFGPALFFGGSTITPAISMLSVVEGLKGIQPSLKDVVVPSTTVILIGLFLAHGWARQRPDASSAPRDDRVVRGHRRVRRLGHLAQHPNILLALSPTYAGGFLAQHLVITLFALAAVVVTITGAEALYADRGHFAHTPIAQAWLALVFPAWLFSCPGVRP